MQCHKHGIRPKQARFIESLLRCISLGHQYGPTQKTLSFWRRTRRLSRHDSLYESNWEKLAAPHQPASPDLPNDIERIREKVSIIAEQGEKKVQTIYDINYSNFDSKAITRNGRTILLSKSNEWWDGTEFPRDYDIHGRVWLLAVCVPRSGKENEDKRAPLRPLHPSRSASPILFGFWIFNVWHFLQGLRQGSKYDEIVNIRIWY